WPTTMDALLTQTADQSLQPADVMLSQDTAEAMGLDVGDRFDLPVYFGMLPMQVSGIFTANDPAADQWQIQPNTLSPRLDDAPPPPRRPAPARARPRAGLLPPAQPRRAADSRRSPAGGRGPGPGAAARPPRRGPPRSDAGSYRYRPPDGRPGWRYLHPGPAVLR